MIFKRTKKPWLQSEWKRHFCIIPREIEDYDNKFFVWLSFAERRQFKRSHYDKVWKEWVYRLPRKRKKPATQ